MAVMARMVETQRPLAELASVVQRLPQVLVNVKVADRDSICALPTVRSALAEAERELGTSGRILLRPSGTEQLVRVMVEAPTQQQADAVAHRVADVVAAV
jgi:phosphoglucosamine mutase